MGTDDFIAMHRKSRRGPNPERRSTRTSRGGWNTERKNREKKDSKATTEWNIEGRADQR